MYCNHCAPCPAGLNIGLINKYYDLAKIGDAMAADHYRKLEKHASDCVACGHCDRPLSLPGPPVRTVYAGESRLVREIGDARTVRRGLTVPRICFRCEKELARGPGERSPGSS